MKLVSGNIWDMVGKTDLLCVTTNSTIKKNGELVMGGGSAKQAVERYPYLSVKVGKILVDRFADNDILKLSGWVTPFYGLITYQENGQEIGLFQTKYNWKDKSNIELIDRSRLELQGWIEENNPDRVDMVFPGIGLGELKREDVLPILTSLSDNVYIWELK